jgi:hypothetical protein
MLHNPHENVHARLGPSPIHGVGVFAIRDIAEGTYIFPDDEEELVWISKYEVNRLSTELRRLYDDFAIIRGNLYGCPQDFNKMTPTWYFNESSSPNVACDKEYRFYAIRKIKKDEELTVNYDSYSDRPDDARPDARASD